MKLSRQMPTNALRVFEAVARLLSFTKAGDELGMSQTAVSYQIKLLEEMLGEALFLRRSRQITLTEAGENLLPSVSQAFEILAEGIAAVRRNSMETLTVSSTMTFAQQWLARRIGRFQIAYPNIAVRLITGQSAHDPGYDSADVAVRWGKGEWPDQRQHKIMPVNFSPMLSPRLAESISGIDEPADLLKLRLIDPGDVWWRIWFRAAGIVDPPLDAQPRSRLGVQAIEAHSAMSGFGVGILTPAFYRDEVARGTLFQPFALVATDGSDYFLTYAETRRHIAKIKAFRDWVIDEMNADAADASAL